MSHETFLSENQELIVFLESIKSCNGFAMSLLNYFQKKGTLSEKQQSAGLKMMQKIKNNEKEAEKKGAVIDLSRINALFSSAMNSGLKRPSLHIGDISISIAPSSGKNFGFLYVKHNSVYSGKISPEGKYLPTRAADEGIAVRLLSISSDPLKEMQNHGNMTGACSCCGKPLSDERSIELGIGPVCAKRWGITSTRNSLGDLEIQN